MRNTDILNMLTQEQLDRVEDVFYEFIKEFGYEINDKFNEDEQHTLKKQIQKNKDLFIRNYKYDYDEKKIMIQFVRRKYRSKEILNKSRVVVLNINGKVIERDIRDGIEV